MPVKPAFPINALAVVVLERDTEAAFSQSRSSPWASTAASFQPLTAAHHRGMLGRPWHHGTADMVLKIASSFPGLSPGWKWSFSIWNHPQNTVPSKALCNGPQSLPLRNPELQGAADLSWHGKCLWGQQYYLRAFPGGSTCKESTCSVEDLRLTPGLGRSPGEGNSYPPQCSGLENSMDCIVHGVTKSQTQLSDFPCHFPCESPLYIGNHKWFLLFSITLFLCNLEILTTFTLPLRNIL